MTQAEKLLFLLDHKRMTDKQKLETISEALGDICREQRDSDIEKIGNLLAAEYSETTTINLEFELPLVTDKTDSDERHS